MSALAAYGSSTTFVELTHRLTSGGVRVLRSGSIDDLASSSGSVSVSGHDWFVVHVVGRLPPVLAQLPQSSAAKLILFVEDPVEECLVGLSSTLAALVVKQGTFTTEEMQLVVDKARHPQPLGLERYLPEHAPLKQMRLTRSTERGMALMEMDRYFTGLSLDPRRVSQLLTIADELLTNAFYHAPVDGSGGHPYSHVSRMDPVESHPDRPVELLFSRNEHRAAVAIRDHYGSLEQPSLRLHLARAISNPKANFRVSGAMGGAGLGLINAVRGASQLIFNIVPRRLTECIGILETGGSYRRFLEEGRSLQLFSLPDATANV